jgi:dolichol-phosphate mannosyltransferase
MEEPSPTPRCVGMRVAAREAGRHRGSRAYRGRPKNARNLTWVVIPTYNEVGNLEPLVRAVLPILEKCCATGVRILVVDDNSPDGTGRLADALADEIEAVEVLHRPGKEGIGRAYVAGFEHALAREAGCVVEMDADFSHEPESLDELIGAVKNGADLALGSRYVVGGAIESWGLVRRVVSRGGCWYARRVLGVGVRDLTGGFKCFDARSLRKLEPRTIRSQGYAFQVELTYRALRQGMRVKEVPICFRERRDGGSKMSVRIALEAAWLVPLLRWQVGTGPVATAARPFERPFRPTSLGPQQTEGCIEG